MRPELEAAHLRMLSALKVRTHERRMPPAVTPAFGNRRGDGRAKPVKIGGVQYRSGSEARLKLQLSYTEFREMLKDGRAKEAPRGSDG